MKLCASYEQRTYGRRGGASRPNWRCGWVQTCHGEMKNYNPAFINKKWFTIRGIFFILVIMGTKIVKNGKKTPFW